MKINYSIEIMRDNNWERKFALPKSNYDQVCAFVKYLQINCECDRIRVKKTTSLSDVVSYMYFKGSDK